MAVVFKEEIGAGRTATNNMGVRTYQRQFRLETTSRADGPYAVGSDSNVPVIGEAHPEDALAYCNTLQVDNTEDWKGWTVTASYTTERVGVSETATSDGAIITWGSEQFQKPAVFDKDGDLIVNSAGDPFDPPLMMDDSRRVVTVEKNLSSVPAWILSYQDAVNSDTFSVDGVSIAAGIAKMQSVTVGPVQIRGATAYRTVTFTMHLQRDGWILQPLDAGFRKKDGTDRVNITNDGDNDLPAAPVPLDGSGDVLTDPSPTNCVFLSFDVYKTLAFSSLPLT